MYHKVQESFTLCCIGDPDQQGSKMNFIEHKRCFDLEYVILDPSEASLALKNSRDDTRWCMEIAALQQQ